MTHRGPIFTQTFQFMNIIAKPMGDIDPYRDDRPSLIAENARLRKELAKSKRRGAWPAVIALAAYVVLITELRDWLNGNDPTRYWIAVASILGALGISIAIAIRLLFLSGRS